MTNQEIIKYMQENTHLTGYSIAKNLKIPAPKIYNLAKEYNIPIIKTRVCYVKPRNEEDTKQGRIKQAIKDNLTLSAREIANKIGEKDTSWITKIAKDIGIVLPPSIRIGRPKDMKKEKKKEAKLAKITKETKFPGSHIQYSYNTSSDDELEEDVTLTRAEEALRRREERRKEIEANRPKGEYTQSKSPYGLTEEFGISVKTKK
jgi:hypothetical protein